jgi:hypothetical protein
MEESMCVNGLHLEISTTETKRHATAKKKRCRTRRKELVGKNISQIVETIEKATVRF